MIKEKESFNNESKEISLLWYLPFWIGLPLSFAFAVEGNKVAQVIAIILSAFVVIGVCYICLGILNCLLSTTNEDVTDKYSYIHDDYDDCGW